MNENYKIIRKDEIVALKWAGGDISNLFIYPTDCIYKDKDFLVSISTATVDLKVSQFTDFKDYNRIIMILDKELKLVHNDDKSVKLSKNTPYFFDGADDTVSYSDDKLVDFNIIFRKDKCFVDTNLHSIEKDSIIYPKKAFYDYDNIYEVLYCTKGSIVFNINGSQNKLNAGDVLVLNHKELEEYYYLVNLDAGVCDIISSMIMCNN